MKARLSAPIGLKDIAVLMGKKPTETEIQRVRRLIKRREAVLQERILVQPRKGGPFETTLAVLKRTMPDLFPSRDVQAVQEALGDLHGDINQVKEEMATLKRRDHILGDHIVKLQAKLARLEEKLAVNRRQPPSQSR